ncbi:MAG: penicillin acylase family protein [Gemmatimonadaceae bacterium]|nr:penicillin acylase family protein [Gemmatimonadaceae bacterium]
MFVTIAAASVLAGVGSCATNTAASAISPAGTEILWDTYGVPHIYAKDRNSLAYAFGWAQMRNHSDLLLRLVLQGRGRASEFLGKSYLDDDRWVWTIGIPAMSARDYAAQRPAMRAHIDAFAAGINAFAAANPTMVGDSVRAALPVRGVDIIENLQRLTWARFITSSQGVKDQTRAWENGSNAWAIAPSRSANGHAMLLQNPHLPWSDLFTWMEAEYSMPGVHVYGAAVIGAPVLQIAFNDNLGWSHTVNTQDGEDLYELTLSGKGYLFNGKERAFDESVHVIKVRAADGSLTDDTVHFRHSVHGPIVAMKAGKAIANRAVGMDTPTIPFGYEQWWTMGAARNFSEFEKAITPNQISGQNITYADRDGHIMEFYGGNTPVRNRGDRAYWSGTIRGDSSSNLWTSLHTYAEMPKTIDPPSGWVQNANDPPWWATFPVVVRQQDYPSYLATKTMLLRPQRSVRMLMSDSSISFDELVKYKHSTRMELADRALDDLVAAAAARGTARAKSAASVLRAWDRSADAGSRGAVLFNEWWSEYGRRMGAKSRWSVQWSEQRPLDTPYGLADTALAVASLDAAAATVEKKYGALDVPWGNVYRFRRDSLDLPANGAPSTLGVFRVVDYAKEKAEQYRATSGDSYVGAVEFSSRVRAMTLIGYGNASRAGSPHRHDQLRFLSRKELRPVWLGRREVETHTEMRERF